MGTVSVLPSTLSLVSNTGCLAQSSCSINLLNECSVAKVEGSEGSESHSGVSNSLRPHGLYRVRNSPGQNTGVGSLSLLQGIFPTQGSNPGLPHCRQILYQLSHQGSPRIVEWAAYPFSRGSSWSRNRTGVSWIACIFFTNWVMRETPVAKSSPTLHDSMDYNPPEFPVTHHLPDFAQVHVHCIGDAIQPSHPLLPPSPSAFNLSQHQGLFQWVDSSHQVAKVLEFQLQHQSFQWVFRIDFLSDWLVRSSCSLRDSQESSSASQFEGIDSLSFSLLYGWALTNS